MQPLSNLSKDLSSTAPSEDSSVEVDGTVVTALSPEHMTLVAGGDSVVCWD